MNKTGTASPFAPALDAGLRLVRLRPGSKTPVRAGWQLRGRGISGSAKIDKIASAGVHHLDSRTCCIDVDDFALCVGWFKARGIDLTELLGAPDAVQIISGRRGRTKLLYRLPADVDWLPYLKTADGKLELRCANSATRSQQDVLPPSIHPKTGEPYAWGGSGDISRLPTLPDAVMRVWREAVAAEAHAPAANDDTAHRSTRARGRISGDVPKGDRDNTVFRLARSMVQRGYDQATVNRHLQKFNAEHCKPPLGADEVDAKVDWAFEYGAAGCTMLPNSTLLDSPAWRALPPASHDLIILAFRRFRREAPDEPFVLTWEDFKGRPRFRTSAAFYGARALVVQSGIFLPVSRRRNAQTGHVHDLFVIAPSFRQVRKTNMAPSTKNEQVVKSTNRERGGEGGNAVREIETRKRA